MRSYMKTLAALGFGVASLLGNAERSSAQQNSVIAIDVALKSDATMIQHAKANNARLPKAYPKGFALDATHNPHVTLLQQFVRTADLDKVYAAANKALAGENPMSWKLKAFKYYYIPDPPIGLAGIVVEPTDDLRRLQQKIIAALAPSAVKTGTAAAFMSTEDGRDIQGSSDRLRNQFRGDRSIWPEIQSARHNWCRHRSLLEGNARGTVRGVHVLASVSVGLPAWHFWYGSKGTEGLGVEALIPSPIDPPRP